MQPPGPLPDPSPQIHQQLPVYPHLPPVALAALALVVEALRTRQRTRQLTWLCIPQGSGMRGGVGPRQEGAYVYLSSLSFVACAATSFVHAPSFMSAPGCHPVHSPPRSSPHFCDCTPFLFSLTRACPCAAVCVRTRSFGRACCTRCHLIRPCAIVRVCTWSPPRPLTPSFIASFLRLHPLPVLPHSCMPMRCRLCLHPLVRACMCLCCRCACVCAHPLLLYCHS
jgi:hypothetical protein